MSAEGRDRDIPSNAILQPIGELDSPVSYEAGKNLACKRFGQRGSTEKGVSVGRLVRSVGDFSEPEDGGLAVTHDTKDKPGDMSLHKQHGSGKPGSLLEKFVIRSATRRK